MSQVPAVYAAINAVAAALGAAGISKERKNQQQGFMYRGIEDVYAALSALLAEHKLVIIPRVLSREQTERQSNKGGALFSVVVRTEFDIVSVVDGSVHTAAAYGEAMDSADKATNKAMSVAYKYMAFQLFCIPIEGQDMDPDATAHDVRPTGAAPSPESKQKAARAPADDQAAKPIDVKGLAETFRTSTSLDELRDACKVAKAACKEAKNAAAWAELSGVMDEMAATFGATKAKVTPKTNGEATT